MPKDGESRSTQVIVSIPDLYYARGFSCQRDGEMVSRTTETSRCICPSTRLIFRYPTSFHPPSHPFPMSALYSGRAFHSSSCYDIIQTTLAFGTSSNIQPSTCSDKLRYQPETTIQTRVVLTGSGPCQHVSCHQTRKSYLTSCESSSCSTFNPCFCHVSSTFTSTSSGPTFKFRS